uniref:Putative kunitz n=1 Tax=Ixodes ricinus TaxID=34613 RepID=A0A6B0UD44_IXORI
MMPTLRLIFVVSLVIVAFIVEDTASSKKPKKLYGGCFEDKKVGDCKGDFPRYYFDFNSKRCELFYYGGCEGTGNNFLTQKECEEKCGGIRKN